MALYHPSSRGRPFRASLPGQITLTYFAAAFFTLTLFTDWAYVQTTILMWRDFSSWLLFFGLIVAGVGCVLWLIGLLTRRPGPSWGAVGMYVLVMLAAFFNSLLHAGDGWTAIMPWGITLSVVTCGLMLLAAVLNLRATAPLSLRTA